MGGRGCVAGGNAAEPTLSDTWQQGADLGLVPGITAPGKDGSSTIQASWTRDVGECGPCGCGSLIFLSLLTPPPHRSDLRWRCLGVVVVAVAVAVHAG